MKTRKTQSPVRSRKKVLSVISTLIFGDLQLITGSGCSSRHIRVLPSRAKSRGLKISQQNMRRLIGNFVNITSLFQSFPGVDILTMSEAHLEAKNELVEAVRMMPDYPFCKPSREDRQRRGSCCIHKRWYNLGWKARFRN